MKSFDQMIYCFAESGAEYFSALLTFAKFRIWVVNWFSRFGYFGKHTKTKNKDESPQKDPDRRSNGPLCCQRRGSDCRFVSQLRGDETFNDRVICLVSKRHNMFHLFTVNDDSVLYVGTMHVSDYRLGATFFAMNGKLLIEKSETPLGSFSEFDVFI